MRKRTQLALLAGVLAHVVACTVRPEYDRPAVAQPDAFRFSTTDALGETDIEWWSLFEDQTLDDLIDEALRNNLDVRIAASRVDEFAARIGITRSAAFPQVTAGADAGRMQNSREIGVGKAGGERISDFFNANLNAGWELDVFGRIRRATDAAVADTLSAEETRRGVILSLVTSVATSYIGLRSLDAQLELSRSKLATRARTVELFEAQFDKGVISQLELAQVRSEYERTAATIPAIERDIALLENSLSVLLGRPPGAIERGRSIHTLGQPPIPAGLPSDLLTRRPDLRAAEQQVIGANERVGVAIADFYPRFSLTASLGLASDELSNLFDNSATTYSLAGGVLAPLFTAGLLENQLGVAEAQLQQSIESYRLAVLTALRESEDALVTRATTDAEAAAQSRQVEALARYAELANHRYDNGYVGYLEVLDAERDLFDAELAQVRLRAERHASIIAIYKAFGGGWVALAERVAEQPEEAAGD
jgi:multidrug efflux system outer membrane protein